MASGNSNPLLVAVLAFGIFGAYSGTQGNLPPKLQAWYDNWFGRAHSGGSGGSNGTSGGCSQASIHQWASGSPGKPGVGVPDCIGQAFCDENGRLPNSIPELDSWGDKKGYHHSDGTWTCPG